MSRAQGRLTNLYDGLVGHFYDGEMAKEALARIRHKGYNSMYVNPTSILNASRIHGYGVHQSDFDKRVYISIGCVKWALEDGYSLHKQILVHACKSSDIQKVQYLVNQNCPIE